MPRPNRYTSSIVVAISAAMAASILFANDGCENKSCVRSYHDWTVLVTGASVTASTSSPEGGLLSYTCRSRDGAESCRWGLVLPDMDCDSGESVGVTVSSLKHSATTSATCAPLPKIEGMRGFGRVLAFDGDQKKISSSVFGQDITATARKKSGVVVAHRFSGYGSALAMVDTYQTLDNIALVLKSVSPEVRRQLMTKACIDQVSKGKDAVGPVSATSFCSCLGTRMRWDAKGPIPKISESAVESAKNACLQEAKTITEGDSSK